MFGANLLHQTLFIFHWFSCMVLICNTAISLTYLLPLLSLPPHPPAPFDSPPIPHPFLRSPYPIRSSSLSHSISPPSFSLHHFLQPSTLVPLPCPPTSPPLLPSPSPTPCPSLLFSLPSPSKNGILRRTSAIFCTVTFLVAFGVVLVAPRRPRPIRHNRTSMIVSYKPARRGLLLR